jgi:hypothetical protein
MAYSDIEVLRVIRKPPLGKLIVEINSVQYENLADIPSASARQRILAAVGDLIVFVDGYNILVQAGLAPPVSSADPTGQAFPPSVTEREATFKTELARQRYEASLAERAIAEPVKVEQEVELDDGPDVEINLVERIDVLFQKYLAADPSLQGRSAGLENVPGGGLRIRVENKYYSQPKEIEDPKVRRALMQALQEWEKAK